MNSTQSLYMGHALLKLRWGTDTIQNVDAITAIGDIAQLGERGVRNAEVGGSSPPISTTWVARITYQSGEWEFTGERCYWFYESRRLSSGIQRDCVRRRRSRCHV